MDTDVKRNGHDEYIEAVPYERLIGANREGIIDPHSATIRDRELEYVKRWRQGGNGGGSAEKPHETLSGLALSGGGIRSATFALGLTQAFAAQDVMRRFDYLSTVSGGGYLGSSLTWLTRGVLHPHHLDGGMTFTMRADQFPYPVDPPGEANQKRRRAKPAQDAQLVYLRQHGRFLTPGRRIDALSLVAVALRGLALNMLVWLPLIAFVLYYVLVQLPWWPGIGLFGERLARWPGYEAVAILGAAAAAVFAAFSVLYSLSTFIAGNETRWRYRMRRWFEEHMRYALWTVAVTVPLALMPIASDQTRTWLASAGFASVLAGIASAVGTFLRAQSTAHRPNWVVSVLAPIGALLMLYGLLIVGHVWAQAVAAGDASEPVLLGFVLAGVVTGVFVNVNLVSLHRYYRDRLMEAFLPDPPRVQAGRTVFSGLATCADTYKLHELAARTTPTGPYHLINTNVILVDSAQWTWRTRGGDSFVLSPLFCGSNATGWRSTTCFLDGDMSLATAMAISGAAANPYAGGGLFRNRPVAVLMALVNVRLGYWVSHPSPRKRFKKRRTHFDTAWRELSGKLDEHGRLVQLSDGGHFDNLGIYELIRRRVRVIVACDGTADPTFGFSDFVTLLQRIETDFGARIVFDEEKGHGLDVLMPTASATFPRNTQLAKRGFTVGRITYSDESTGWLIYVTTNLFKGLGLQTLGYRASNPDFPDQTTADQFFDEAQFEAYRQLGYSVGEAVLKDPECRAILSLPAIPAADEAA